MSRVQEMRAAHDAAHPLQPHEISTRTPNVRTQTNSADCIERALIADGHRHWGFVVYRTTYGNDSAWETCIDGLDKSLRSGLEHDNGLDMLEDGKYTLTIMDDASQFDGASTSTIRNHFTDWCAQALHEEQGSAEEIESRRQEPVPWYGSSAVRYRFCLQIDEDSLHSILTEPLEAWVKLINDDRELKARTESPTEHELDDEDEGVAYESDEEYPPIEGCTDEDVGWMKVGFHSAPLTFYDYLRDPAAWSVLYHRPPFIVVP